MSRRWTIKEENKKRRELIELYERQNKTIKEVGKILGVAESTVFGQLKRLNISTCPEKKSSFLCKRQNIAIPSSFSKELAEFVGIMLGDGHISPTQARISIGMGEPEYVRYICNLIKRIFAVKPKCFERLESNVYIVYVGSVDLVKFLLNMGLATNKVKQQVNIPRWIFSSREYNQGFLRGFFDTDGSIYKLRFGTQMSFCNHSIPLLQSTRNILTDMNYHPSRISSWKIYLTRKLDLYRYAEDISFGNKKHFRKAKEFGICV